MSAVPKDYLFSLCNAIQGTDESFGIAVRIGMTDSSFNVEASKVIHGLLTYSPAPDSMAVEFLNELEKVSGMSKLVQPIARRTSQFDATTWATEVMNFLFTNFPIEVRSEELQPVTNLASEILTHLLIVTRNPGGKKTPQEFVDTTPNLKRLHQIQDLLAKATKRSQSALKKLLFLRDGTYCPFTDQSFAPPGRHVVSRSAHILPFSFQDKALTLSVLERFTGRKLAREVKDNINHPCNAFNAEMNAHDAYDKLAWGIEAVHDGNEWKYFFRKVRPDEISSTIKRSEGQEIFFRRGDRGKDIDKPNPEYCNIKLAIARVMHACGAADIIAGMYWDDDDEAIINQPVYMGGPFVSDETLFRRLHDRLLT